MKNKWFKYISISVLVMLLVGVIALAFPVSDVAAQTPEPPKDKDGKGLIGRRLEWDYKLAQHRLREQGLLFKRMDQGVKQAEGLIAKATEKGVDVKVMQAALTEFKAKKAEAFKLHEAAQAILKEHKGFGDNGKVTDPAAARETLKNASEKMSEAGKIGGEAFKAFMKTLKEWAQVNMPKDNK